MPRYEIVGYGRETGRKRVRIYEAKNEEDAIMMAASEGTIVDTQKIKILPDMPATENQIEYAKDLDIKIPKNATKKELTKLISLAVDEDWPTKKTKQQARKLGIKIPAGITDTELLDLIDDEETEIENEKDQLREQKEDERFDAQLRKTRKTKKSSKAESFLGLIIITVIIIVLIKSCGS